MVVGEGRYLGLRFASRDMAPYMAPAVPSGLADEMVVDRLVVRNRQSSVLEVVRMEHCIVMVVDRLVVRNHQRCVLEVVRMEHCIVMAVDRLAARSCFGAVVEEVQTVAHIRHCSVLWAAARRPLVVVQMQRHKDYSS